MSWYYHKHGQSFGPVSFTDLRALVMGGTVSAEDLVWTDGFSQWARAAQISGLFAEGSYAAAEEAGRDKYIEAATPDNSNTACDTIAAPVSRLPVRRPPRWKVSSRAIVIAALALVVVGGTALIWPQKSSDASKTIQPGASTSVATDPPEWTPFNPSQALAKFRLYGVYDRQFGTTDILGAAGPIPFSRSRSDDFTKVKTGGTDRESWSLTVKFSYKGQGRITERPRWLFFDLETTPHFWYLDPSRPYVQLSIDKQIEQIRQEGLPDKLRFIVDVDLARRLARAHDARIFHGRYAWKLTADQQTEILQLLEAIGVGQPSKPLAPKVDNGTSLIPESSIIEKPIPLRPD